MKKLLKNSQGQAVLLMVLLVTAVILVLIVSVGFLTYNDLKTIDTQLSSTQSYYAAEAGIEDAVYRIGKGKTFATGNYNLVIDQSAVTWNISGPPYVITSAGNTQNRIRKLQADLGGGGTTTISFNNAIQAGYGGVDINPTAVYGDIYSNGPIFGVNSDVVTGSITSATFIDHANDSPFSPPNTIDFRNASTSQDLAQSFRVNSNVPVSTFQFYIRKTSLPTSATVRLTTDNAGNPSTIVLRTGSLDSDLVGTSFSWVSVNITPVTLTPGVTYWVVIDSLTTSATRYYTVGANNTYPTPATFPAQAKVGQQGGAWNNTNPVGLDAYFKIGALGLIDDFAPTGDAWAHTVTNTDVEGTLYCQIDDGSNNKACDTTRADPPPINLPISDAQIAAFKAQAEAGGTIVGDYVRDDGTHFLGPGKITGNMEISGSDSTNIILMGTVYVQGTISINGNVRLDSSYGPSSGVLISDGFIDISTNGDLYGSGDPNSYLLLISTNDCDGNGGTSPTGLPCGDDNSAIKVAQAGLTVIPYASRGKVTMSTSGEVAGLFGGYSVEIGTSVTVNYNSALGNITIPSSGGGSTFNGWKEI